MRVEGDLAQAGLTIAIQEQTNNRLVQDQLDGKKTGVIAKIRRQLNIGPDVYRKYVSSSGRTLTRRRKWVLYPAILNPQDLLVSSILPVSGSLRTAHR